MAFFSTTNTLDRELYLPVAAPAMFKALVDTLAATLGVSHADDFALTAQTSTRSGGFTWGEKVACQVVPTGEGATLKVNVAPRVGGQIGQGSKNATIVDDLFAGVTALLRPAS